MSTARDWFDDEYEFLQLCGDAQSQARGESAQEFAAEMTIKAKQHGLDTYLSPKQLAYLCKIADHDIPKARVSQTKSATHCAHGNRVSDFCLGCEQERMG